MSVREIFFKTTLLIFFIIPSQETIIQEPAATDLYSETPCEIQPLSAFRDYQGNVWGVGDGNLWWYNVTNLSWSLLPLPNGSWPTSDAWRVTCGDPKKYVSLQSSQTTLILHLPWQHWQQVDADSISLDHANIDPDAVWCHLGTLFATDTLRKKLYMLDQDEAGWSLFSELGKNDILNQTNSDKITSKPWPASKGNLYLMESSKSYYHISYANVSGSGWITVKKQENGETWPNISNKTVTWVKENSDLWIWKNEEVWVLNSTQSQWKKINIAGLTLPDLNKVLSTWMKDDNTLCFLVRTETCFDGLYSASATKCWTDFALTSDSDIFTSSTIQSHLSIAPSSENVIATSPLATTMSTTSTIATESPIFVSIHNVVNKHSLLAALQSEIDNQQDDILAHDAVSVTMIPYKKSNPWHQHTSVFGSVIFFGTSITIFGVVGSFWCVRRCVHFPKEALLLKDPPSVRYTAIPDSLSSYNGRSQHISSAYAVIPDSIA